MKTKLLIEQHFHGAFGVDFNTASVEDILYLSKEIKKYGIGGIFPTLVTDTVENIKRQIGIIKSAAERQTSDTAKIFGIHLEGIFLNPEKKGIHDEKLFLEPTIENYRQLEDDFIKVVTIAPEMCDRSLIKYLNSKGIKVQAGHCTGGDLTGCTGVTHLFNAMSGITHREKSTALSALTDDNIYTEIIADGVHVSDDALKLVFKAKPVDKIILISDCLPCTKIFCHSEERSDVAISSNNAITTDTKCPRNDVFTFAGETIYYDGEKAVSKEGTIAGSTALLPDIVKRLAKIGLFTPQLINNTYKYHDIELDGEIEWDDNFNIIKVY